MSATEMIYKIIDEKCLKQSAVARAAGYDPKKFNASFLFLRHTQLHQQGGDVDHDAPATLEVRNGAFSKLFAQVVFRKPGGPGSIADIHERGGGNRWYTFSHGINPTFTLRRRGGCPAS